MKNQAKKVLNFVLEPKSMVFGFAILYLMWVWLRSPEWHYDPDIFLASVLFIGSLMLMLNRVWSNLVAVILSGYLPVEFFKESWMISKNSEIPIFTHEFISAWLRMVGHIETGPLLGVALTIMILCVSVVSILRSSSNH